MSSSECSTPGDPPNTLVQCHPASVCLVDVELVRERYSSFVFQGVTECAGVSVRGIVESSVVESLWQFRPSSAVKGPGWSSTGGGGNGFTVYLLPAAACPQAYWGGSIGLSVGTDPSTAIGVSCRDYGAVHRVLLALGLLGQGHSKSRVRLVASVLDRKG